jgi:hypothetical protein
MWNYSICDCFTADQLQQIHVKWLLHLCHRSNKLGP